MAKVAKETFYLVSSEGTGFFYTNRKNKKKGKGESKLKVRKYDPIARKHVVFEDKKLSRLKKKYVAGASAAPASSDDVGAKSE
jgi:large subunit ribosomal protein L33